MDNSTQEPEQRTPGDDAAAPDSVPANDSGETDFAEGAEEENKKAPVRSDVALLLDEIEILTKKRLSQLDRGPSLAYAARPKGDSHESYFALICDRNVVPRSMAAVKASKIISAGIVKLVASGVVFWPPDQTERYVFVYEKTLGQPLMKKLDMGGLGWKQDVVMNSFIKPMVNILLDLRDADLVHGCINPTNIFDPGSGDGHERIVLGECLSSPPGYLQPTVFETVERAQCEPMAKGPGLGEDDLYAFGVSITMMLRHKDPLAGMSDDEIIRQKIELGSYGALTGKERFTGAILELLRGLLYDDRAQRWTLEEVMSWMQGQRLSPKQSSKKQKASRPVYFSEERYLRPVLLAMDLDTNEPEAIKIIEDGTLEQWVDRSLEDNLVKSRLEQVKTEMQEMGRGAGYSDVLLSRYAMALDPDGPIRFKGMRLHPEGIQYVLADAFLTKKDIMPYAEIISQQVVLYWLSAQQDIRVDVGNLIGKYDSSRAFLRQNTLGYGIERCLYFLCPEVHCLSERLDGYYVRNPEDLMYAYESVSAKPNRPELFIDRHIAAFLSVKDRQMIDPYLVELGAEEYHKRVFANIKVVATIQKRSRMEKFPGIAHWVADILEPVYERYHDRELRDTLRKKIDYFKKQGDLIKIVTLLDDNELRQRDFIDFKKAMDNFRKIREEEDELNHKLQKPETFGRETGQEVAAIISGFLAGIFILAMAFLHFTKTAIF